MTKFTKTPWRDFWGETDEGEPKFIIQNEETGKIIVSSDESDSGLKEMVANANLIKESPAMYDILKYFVNLRKSGEISNDILGSINAKWEEAEEIIERLEGEEN